VFLSAGEIGDRIAAFVRNWRKPTEAQIGEAQAQTPPPPENTTVGAAPHPPAGTFSP
jgi:potassium/hydrogen antiporter